MTRVAICLPMGALVSAHFALCLASVAHVSPVRLALIRGTSSLSAAKARNVCLDRMFTLEEVGKYRFDWTMWFDSDMTFPPNALLRLMVHDKDIIGATYVRRDFPHDLLGHPKGENRLPEKGIAEWDSLPTGVLLVRRAVYDGFKPPIFRLFDNERTGQTFGEDHFFCYRAKELGYSIWVESDLSREIGHVGEEIHSINDDTPEPASRSDLVVPKSTGILMPGVNIPPIPPGLFNGRG